MEFADFVSQVNRPRCKALGLGENFTDKSATERHFLEHYRALISHYGKPSVTEYGGAVPVLSLYLLNEGFLDKVIVVEQDVGVLGQLERVLEKFKLPVEVVRSDIRTMSSFPDTTLGISLNALYGFCPTPAQANNPPVLSRSVILDAAHSGFGVFRYLNGDFPWVERDQCVSQMARFPRVVSGSDVCESIHIGYRNVGEIVSASGRVVSGLHHVLGFH